MSLLPRSSVVVGAMLIAASALSAKAQQAPWEGCRPVSKVEYNSAKQQYLRQVRQIRPNRERMAAPILVLPPHLTGNERCGNG